MAQWYRPMFVITLLVAALSGSAGPLGGVAYAQDDKGNDKGDGDLLEEEETEEEKKAREEAAKARLQEADKIEKNDDESELDKIEGGTGKDDLLGGEGTDQINQKGQDTAEIYRKAAAEYSELAPDEEMLAWDRYFQKYPKTLYRSQIEKRLDELEAQLYEERRNSGEEDRLDADKREVPISQGLLIENINPRSRFSGGFEWGLPDYINLMLDYEHGIRRDFSVHGGIRNRFQVWNFEFGARYSLIKSSRTKTLVTAIGDFRMALDPAYLAFRPQIAFGKMVGIVDLQGQLGADLEMRSGSSVRLIGGANVTIRPDENVAIFVETTANAKNLTWDEGGSFRFPVGSFGLKFYPKLAGRPPQALEINLGASIPYATRYYRWHDGSVMGQVNFYL
jgi:hypothetical protein